MASKIQSYTFYVAITPYKVEHGSEEEFNELSVMAAYDDRRKYFYVDLHAGWKSSWGSHGCIIMGNNDPLTAPKFIKVKDAPKNSQKFINEMGANLEQAKDVIAWLFDKRDWGRLYPAVQNIALHGYLDAYRQQMEELMKTADPEPKQEQKPNVLKQYAELKEKKPDAMLLFRCGDFYETYEDDAAEAAKVLGITLTKSTTTSVRMAGFPHHALDTYLPKLIRAGKRVAICDEINDNSNNQNMEDDNMRLSINSNQESANVQPAAQVNNPAIEREQSGAGSGYAEREQGRPNGNPAIEEAEAVEVGEVTMDSIQPTMQPVESEKGKVNSEKSAAAQTSSIKPQTSSITNHPSSITHHPSSLPMVQLVVYTTKRGEQAPRIEGFGGENDPRWKRHYDDKVRLAQQKKEADAFNEKLQAQMKGKPKAEREKLRKQWKSVGSDPFGASYFTDRTTGDKCYQMTMGAKYMDVARELVDAYNSGDEQAIAAAEQAIIDCKNGIVQDIEAEKAAKRAEREAKKSEKGKVNSEKLATAQPAMSAEEAAMFDLFKKFMAGDKEAMAKVGAVIKQAA